MDMAVFEMGKCLHEVSLSSKGTVCYNGILKAIFYKRDCWEMFQYDINNQAIINLAFPNLR